MPPLFKCLCFLDVKEVWDWILLLQFDLFSVIWVLQRCHYLPFNLILQLFSFIYMESVNRREWTVPVMIITGGLARVDSSHIWWSPWFLCRTENAILLRMSYGQLFWCCSLEFGCNLLVLLGSILNMEMSLRVRITYMYISVLSIDRFF